MRILVTGGAGFLGTHLCRALLRRGDTVVCLDDAPGSPVLAGLAGGHRYSFVRHDVREPITIPGSFDAVAHLASPASPPDYLSRPIYTLTTGAEGTRNALEFAGAHGARFLLTSTSEVYGDPLQHPQQEKYWGNVNPVGPRSVYDEAKRYAESLTTAFRGHLGLDTGIVRIFNTFGPGMHPDDGRVVSTFIHAALHGKPLTVFGDGTQTRSLCYVDDLVRGLIAMLDADEPGPVNLGNPTELTVRRIAELVREACAADVPIVYHPLPQDDPTRRRPDITLARTRLGWSPEVPVAEGIARTVAWQRGELSGTAS